MVEQPELSSDSEESGPIVIIHRRTGKKKHHCQEKIKRDNVNGVTLILTEIRLQQCAKVIECDPSQQPVQDK